MFDLEYMPTTCLHGVLLFQANNGPNSNGCQVSAQKNNFTNFIDYSYFWMYIYVSSFHDFSFS